MNQPIAVVHTKEDIQRMAAPSVASATRSANRRSLATLIVGLAVAAVSLQQHWLEDDLGWWAIAQALCIFCFMPVGVVRHYALRNLDRLPALMKDGATLPARLTGARTVGGKQRVGLTWNERGRSVTGQIDVPEMLGYMHLDTTILVGRSRYLAVVLGDQIFVGPR
jgi:hypothetical protein